MSYVSGILINIVGFIGAIDVAVPVGATYLYNLNFFCGFVVSFTVYYTLTRVWPIPATSKTWNEIDADVTNLSVAYNQGSYESIPASNIDEESQSRTPSSAAYDEPDSVAKGGKGHVDVRGTRVNYLTR